MPMWNQFPYTNFHEQNDDWMLRTIKELQTEISMITGEKLLETVKQVVMDMGVSAVYDASTETISFKLEGKVNA